MSSFKLPQENLPSVRKSRLLVDILGSLAMLVVLNFAALWYLGGYSTHFGYWTIHNKWQVLEHMEQEVDWLILGDSSCNQGVMPALFESELGETAINLCTTGNMGALGDLWILEEYIARFGVPHNVLIVHVYDVWHRDVNPVMTGQIPRPWGFWEAHSFGSAWLEDPQVRREAFLERFVPLYSLNRTLGSIIRDTVLLRHNPFVPMWRLEPDGFLPAWEAKPDNVRTSAAEHVSFVSENVFSISYVNDNAMQEIVELADRLGFTVYLANSPVYEGLYADPAYQAYFAGVFDKLAEFAGDSPNVHYLTAVRTFPAELMQNPDHLIVDGAEQYTLWLIGEILLRR